MEKLGTNYGGWYIPTDIELNENSIIYSAGVGEDISFDILLSSKYNCNIYLIDPTTKSKIHYEETKNYFLNNILFTGNIQSDYYDKINGSLPNFNKIFYNDVGLWNKKDILKFYKQHNENYVSQSLIVGMFGSNYNIVNVDTIKNIMQLYNHKTIDLLKLDIEGAEINVLEQMLDDNIFPKYLCVEFDLKLKNKDFNNLSENLINRLLGLNYKILINDDFNITFKRI
uniref:Methyltransferase FkbM domain-containing protein n=1 Tax=viral metagenome TaxID=1070528 RepID=A0A6C0JLW9_9ZZZZ